MTVAEQQFDVAPVTRAVTARGIAQDERIAPTIWRLYHRATARGHCNAATADKLAIRLLGTHPALLWGEDWWRA